MDRVKKMVHYWCDDIKKVGLTGKGVTVAVLDTGLAPHPDFKSRVIGWRDCIYRKEKCYDDNGHGTHVAGILGGSGQMSGGILSGSLEKQFRFRQSFQSARPMRGSPFGPKCVSV